MTEYQKQLIAKLAANRVPIQARFSGPFLNCRAIVTGKKKKPQKFAFLFDTADDCQGAALLWDSLKGAYSEVFAEQAANIIKAHSDEIAMQPIA